MTGPGQEDEMPTEGGSRNQPGAALVTRTGESAGRSRQVRRSQRMAILRIGLGILLSRRFHELVICAVIALAALAGLARENQTRTWARLVAWDRRQNLRHQRTAKARPA
jgi:hypothetical protein